jgi:hypothetical protein
MKNTILMITMLMLIACNNKNNKDSSTLTDDFIGEFNLLNKDKTIRYSVNIKKDSSFYIMSFDGVDIREKKLQRKGDTLYYNEFNYILKGRDTIDIQLNYSDKNYPELHFHQNYYIRK